MPVTRGLFRVEGRGLSPVRDSVLVRTAPLEGEASSRTITRPRAGTGTGRGTVTPHVSIGHRIGAISAL